MLYPENPTLVHGLGSTVVLMGTHLYRLLKAVSSNLIKTTFFSSRQRQSIILPEDDKLSFRLRPIKFPSPNSKLLPGNVNTASYNCRERTGAQYWKRGAKRKNLWEVVWGIFIFTFCWPSISRHILLIASSLLVFSCTVVTLPAAGSVPKGPRRPNRSHSGGH